jgi:putative peptidoglycan lipid II flippase
MASGFLLVVAASVALVAAPLITQVLFQHGAFASSDTAGVALLVRIMLPGFLTEGMALILVQGMLAMGRNDIALRLGYLRLALQLALSVVFGLMLGAVGVAIAYSCSLAGAFGYALLLARRLGLLELDRRLLVRTVAGCSLILASAGLSLAVGQILPAWAGASLVLLVSVLSAIALGIGGLLLEAVGRSSARRHDSALPSV